MRLLRSTPFLIMPGPCLAGLGLLLLTAASALAERPATEPPPTGATEAPVGLARQLAEAQRLMRVGQFEAARPFLEATAAAAWPCRDLALVLLGRCQLAMGQNELALASARQVEGSVPMSVRLADAEWLAADAMKAARSAEAGAAYVAFAARWPSDERAARVPVEEADALERAGLSARAALAWRRAAIEAPALGPDDARERATRLATTSGTSLPPLSAAERLDVAKKLAAANLHERAAAAWADAGRGATGDAAARCLVERARSLYNLRRNDAARETCEEALRRHPASSVAAECSLLIARVASRQGDGATIQRVAAKALADPRWKAEGWRHDLGALRAARLVDDKQVTEAIAAYSKLAKEASGDRAVDAAWKAAWNLLQAGRAAEAAQAMENLARTQDLDTEVGRNARLWRALALERALSRGGASGTPEPRADEPSAIDLLADLYRARPWSYYGQQARELLALRLPLEAMTALDAEAFESGSVFQNPGAALLPGVSGERYILLRDVGLFPEALAEIEELGRDAGRRSGASAESRAFLFELARAASRAGELARGSSLLSRIASEAVRLPSRKSPPEFWEVLYPRPHGEIVDRFALRSDVAPAFCSAIVRAESAWRPEVRSASDARGLMQLIPPTATRLARQGGLANFDAEQLFDPETNVRLGASYLGALLAIFDGDMAAAAASYNAGEMKVSEWWEAQAARGVTQRVERIESIPFRETRVYVKRVLEATGWYSWLERCGDVAAGSEGAASGS